MKRVSLDPLEGQLAYEQLYMDMRGCVSCGEPNGPEHASVSYGVDNERGVVVVFSTRQCDSGSRWYNPGTRQMEGNPHCTCDSCF